MTRKSGLGKGLEALLSDNDELPLNYGATKNVEDGSGQAAPTAGTITRLPTEKLIPSPRNARRHFDEAELRDLADSITQAGIISPIVAADMGEGIYMIVAGHRRHRAAQLAGLTEVPVIVREYTDEKRMEISLIENTQRVNLNPIEEASGYKDLMDFSGFSQEEVALRVGKSRSTVANALRLLRLPADMQKSVESGVESGGISPGHARALLSVIDTKTRERLFQDILSKSLSVRETEKRAATVQQALKGETGLEGEVTHTGETGAEKAPPKRPVELTDMEEKFIGRLGTKVTIEGGLAKGRIHIDYYSMEDLDRLYGLLGG